VPQIVVFLGALCLIGCDHCVRIGNAQFRHTLLDSQAIRQRINLEKEAALGDAHILDDWELDDAAADSSGDVHHIGIDRTVARCRVSIAFAERIKREHDSDGDYRDRDQSAARRVARFTRSLHPQCPKPMSQNRRAVITPMAVQTAS